MFSRKFSVCGGNLHREFPQSQLINFSAYHLAITLRQKSTARIFACLNELREMLSPTGNSPPEIHSKNFASLNFLCPTKLHLCPQTYTLCPLFQSLPRPPHSLPRPPYSLPSPLRSQGLLQLRGSRAVERHLFRWKEIDVFFTIAVTLLQRRIQTMADNYLGRQSRTGGGAIHVTRPFQVPDT